MTIGMQIIWLFVLALVIACISWTVTHEEIFRELREYCEKKSREGKNSIVRKFFYVFTCEYCFSHYVVIACLIITHFTMLFSDWRGYIISGFALVWIANVYMSLYNLLRVDIKVERMVANNHANNE